MPTRKDKAKDKRKSPFRDIEDLKKEITDFINYHKATVVHQAERISDFFEMSCFNYVVTYYTRFGYEAEPASLQKGLYKYKCSTMGKQYNFSHFNIKKVEDGVEHLYEIHHNLAVQSAHHHKIFTTPDITIIKADGVSYTKEHYENKITFSYVEQANLISFCEVKQFAPFPELLFNFIGIINELYPTIITDTTPVRRPVNLAPTLMVSGSANRHLRDIRKSLMDRYCINVIYNLFYSATSTFSKKNVKDLRQIGPNPTVVTIDDDWEEDDDSDDDGFTITSADDLDIDALPIF